ncbi:hypothetical protein [Paenibacillus sp. V4I5]|uniref:hypothetical protein n=1 Tax=Paenibacillus sp. V4I5 TaxID=3042306 RepID=UPI00278E84E1|nr:hypothetical protein [Paenibacillus sp. V4I5]MDQ0917557.1 hypothetical protein [Paenibacillus sp. V4I5]
MSGLFDYLFGIHMEEQDPSNKQSLKFLERAYTQLAPFPTILAHTVKTTLSFKLNWFSRLRNLPEQSIFYQLGYFLNNYYEDNATRNFARGSFAGPLYGVYVDDFHFLYHEAVILLFAKEAEELGKKLSAIRGVYNKKSVTNKEKLELLEGRYYQLIGDNKRAVMAYGSMSYHPIFSKEVDLIKMKM